MSIAYAMGRAAGEQVPSIQWMSFLPLLVLIIVFGIVGYLLGGKRRGRQETSGPDLLCTDCGSSCREGDKFCRKCGQALR